MLIAHSFYSHSVALKCVWFFSPFKLFSLYCVSARVYSRVSNWIRKCFKYILIKREFQRFCTFFLLHWNFSIKFHSQFNSFVPSLNVKMDDVDSVKCWSTFYKCGTSIKLYHTLLVGFDILNWKLIEISVWSEWFGFLFIHLFVRSLCLFVCLLIS